MVPESIPKRGCASPVLTPTTARRVESIKVSSVATINILEIGLTFPPFPDQGDDVGVCERSNTKLQNAVCYAIDGDQINVLNILAQKMEEPWMPFRVRKPLLHIACERGAWKCVQHLVQTRSDEINLIKDEYYPIHQAVLHDGRFLELLIQHGAITTVRTCTQQMTLLHVGKLLRPSD